MTDTASTDRVARQVADEFGHLDILVNNAGIASFTDPEQTTAEKVRRALETNVVGLVAVTNAVLPLLRKARAARIVNVSSELGSVTAISDRQGAVGAFTALAYPVSEAAVNMVTVQYAKLLAETPIRVNAVMPGYCATDLNGHRGTRSPEQGAELVVHLATIPEDGPHGVLWGHVSATGTTLTEMLGQREDNSPGIIDRLNASTPLRRAADPEEIAQAAAWLLSDRSSYVTGTVLRVDGGVRA